MNSQQREPATAEARLARAVRALHGGKPTQPPVPASLDERVATLERDVQETRTRVNALFFTVITAAVGQLVTRLFG